MLFAEARLIVEFYYKLCKYLGIQITLVPLKQTIISHFCYLVHNIVFVVAI